MTYQLTASPESRGLHRTMYHDGLTVVKSALAIE
jgi:hypothetical protein